MTFARRFPAKADVRAAQVKAAQAAGRSQEAACGDRA
jgi:hypothetical protein